MNIKEAISLIKKNSNWKIVEDKSKKTWGVFEKHYWREYSDRELIKLANILYKNQDQKQTNINKTVKNLSSRKDRSATRDLINKQDFDNIPTNKPTKQEDPWGWD